MLSMDVFSGMTRRESTELNSNECVRDALIIDVEMTAVIVYRTGCEVQQDLQ